MSQTHSGAMKIVAKRAGVTLDEFTRSVNSGQKWCWRCREWKPIAEYCADRSRYDGRCSQCKACRYPPRSRLVFSPKVRDRLRYSLDPAYRAERRQHAHARKRGVAPIAAIGQEYLLEKFGGVCAYCRVRPATTWDHIEPVSAGGETVPGNIVPACMTCNSSKSDRDLFNWMQRKGYIYSPELESVLILYHCGLRAS